jgi:GSH-dependent disulfide-bond oxidoreductase
MIELHFANSGNSLRTVIVLEECALPYCRHKLDLAKDEHKSAEFLKINPFGMVPAMYDSDGPGGNAIVITQSAAIMLYLAEKTGRLIPADPVRRARMMQWFMMAASDVGPANAIILYMNNAVPDLSDAGRAFLVDRFVNLIRGVEAHLAENGREYLADELSLADFALFPAVRIRRSLLESAGGFDHLFRWADRIMARPSVQRAIAA